MPYNSLMGFALWICYFIVTGILSILLKNMTKVPSELVRKTHHIIVVMSVFPLLYFFETWQASLVSIIIFMAVVYPILALVERYPIHGKIFVQRNAGEVKKNLLVVHLMLSALILFFWGYLGAEYKYIIIVSIMAWGYGDAAAALVGKAYGRRHVNNPHVEGAKTVEGTLAMLLVSGIAIFISMLIFSQNPWYLCLATAILISPVCAAVELFSRRGMDTVTVPFASSFLTLALVWLVKLVGV